jgi:hypothetical protein
MDKLTLVNLNKGAALEIFERDNELVMQNIKDANTEPEAERSITLVLKYKPNPDRSGATVVIESKVKTAGVKACRGSIFIAMDKGKAIAYPKDPRQDALFSEETSSTKN